MLTAVVLHVAVLYHRLFLIFPDTSLFFRVEFVSLQPGHEPELVVLWINLKTLLPIAVNNQNNVLYAVVPETSLFPSDVRHMYIFTW